MNDDSIRSFLIKEPEKAFDSPYLSYKSRAIETIIEYFEMALEQKEVYKTVRQLLAATSDFRHATVPDGLFQQLRTSTKSDEDLEKIFKEMNRAFTEAEQDGTSLNAGDKKILAAAVDFCKKSIKERMSSLMPDDRLVPFWRSSELKKRVE